MMKYDVKRVKYTGATDTQVSFAGSDPRPNLWEGKVYDVEYVDECDWSSVYILSGIKGLQFNTVCFEVIE